MPKISQLPVATTLTGAEIFPAVQSGVTKKATTGQIQALLLGKGVQFSTRLLAIAATISIDTVFIQTFGYNFAGDGGGTVYIRASGPTTGGFQSADGQWWKITLLDYVTPEMFGADGTATNDTTGIQLATNTGIPVLFAPRTYLLNDPGAPEHGILLNAAFTWVGAGIDKTILQVSAPTEWTPIINPPGNPITGFKISGITFDANNNLPPFGTSHRYPNFTAMIEINTANDAIIENNKFINWNALALLVNDSINTTVRNNYIARSSVINTQNFGLLLYGKGGDTHNNNYALDNVLFNCVITVAGNYYTVARNTVIDWGFSFAINCQQTDNHVLIDSNHLIGGGNRVADVFGVYPGGIEAWAEDSIYSNNVIENCPGPGIGGGPLRGLITGNRCCNNGKNPATTTNNSAGIAPFGGDASFNGNYCFITGNTCSNTDGSTTQDYGIYVGGNVAQTGIVVEGNQLIGNSVAPYGASALANVVEVRDNHPAGTSTQTGDYSQTALDNSVTFNKGSSATLTLLTASFLQGKRLLVRTIQAQTVISASADVVPLIGGSAGNAILAATAGKWALLESNGTNWVIIAGN